MGPVYGSLPYPVERILWHWFSLCIPIEFHKTTRNPSVLQLEPSSTKHWNTSEKIIEIAMGWFMHNVHYVFYGWTVPEDIVPTNIYMSSYLRHRTVQYEAHSRLGAQS